MFRTLRQKRSIAFLLIISLVVMLSSGCNQNDTGEGTTSGVEETGAEIIETSTDITGADQTSEQTQETENPEDAIPLEKLTLTGDATDLNLKMMASDGQRMYLYGSKFREVVERNYYHDCFIICCDMDGANQTVVYTYEKIISDWDLSETFSIGYWTKLCEMTVTADGNLLVLFRGTETDMAEYRMVKFDPAGNELWQTVIGINNYLTPALVCASESIYTHDGEKISVYDQNGILQKQITLGELPEWVEREKLSERIRTVQVTDDERSYVGYGYGHQGEMILFEINLETGELGEWQEISMEPGIDLEVLGGQNSGYDMLLNNAKKLCGLNFGEDVVEMVDWEMIGIDTSRISSMVLMNDGDLLIEYDQELLKANVNDLKATEKQTITIAASSIAIGDLKDRALEFNQTNAQWNVEVVTYDFYDEAVLTQFNLDLVNGNGPDILWLDQTMLSMVPYENYGNQNLFEDLKLWFEQDPELNESDYLTNVFDVLGTDGKWNRLCPEFAVRTWFGKTSVLGEVDHISLSDLVALGEKYSRTVVTSARREVNLRYVLTTRWDQFVNEADGTCSFDSDEFIQVLESLKDYPGEDDPMKYYPADVRTNNLLLMGAELESFRELIEYPAEWCGEDYTIVGYPSASGNGALIVPKGSSISMFADSDCKEGAWEFIRYFFTDEYQMVHNIDGENAAFRVKKSALEGQLESALKPVLGSYGYEYEEVHYEVETPSREELEQWIDYMSSITCAELVDTEVYNIIVEEAGAFFSGQKTAEEVAKIIQSRVWIYLAEQQ